MTVDIRKVDSRIAFACGDSWLGKILVAASRNGICAILPGDDVASLVRQLRAFCPSAIEVDRSDARGAAAVVVPVAAVIAWLAAPQEPFPLPLDPQGTDFQQRVWRALREIAPGTTRSYGDIARALGMPRAARAVARACASNHLAVAIPCHRVVAADGALTGYRWGLERKRALLEREAEAGRNRRKPLKTTIRLAPTSAKTAIHIVA